MKKVSVLLLFLSSFLLAAAQQPVKTAGRDSVVVDSLRPTALKVVGKAVTGTAAIYDTDRDGNRTASGETFFNVKLTAASNELPLNSWVKLTNPKNDKYTIVRINDRITKGEKKRGIKINISQAAGRELGITKDITFKIKIEQIKVSDSDIVRSKYFSEQIVDSLPADSLAPNAYEPVGKPVTGIASFYSYNLDGSKTSTGERYRNARLTAASNHFKLNTWVLVTNLKNNKSVIVRINDRMHPRMKRKGRVVDLSREAARQLDFMSNGLTKVKVQPIRFTSAPDVKTQTDSSTTTDSLRAAIPDSVKTEPIPEDASVTGIASFYSANLDGTKTATGERYRNNKLSAASNHFDLGTWVRVTNLSNNKSVVLRINDRMHARMKAKGRVVDLSRAAAKKLDFIKKGLTKVKVEPVEKGTIE